MTLVIIDGKRYPFAHRNQGSAETAAKHIIDGLNDEAFGPPGSEHDDELRLEGGYREALAQQQDRERNR